LPVIAQLSSHRSESPQ